MKTTLLVAVMVVAVGVGAAALALHDRTSDTSADAHHGSSRSTPTGPAPSRSTPTTDTSTSSGSTAAPARPAGGVLRHDGYRGLRLKMTAAEAADVRGVRVGQGHGCRPMSFQLDGVGKQISGAISAKYGVAGIFAAGRVRTTEGIHLGSTRAELVDAYRGRLTTGPDVFAVRYPDDTEYEFVVDRSGRVTEIVAALNVQDCFG